MAILRFKHVRYSKHSNRFYTRVDMAEAKRLESIYNSQVKRGERPKHGNVRHVICHCGCEGCMFVYGYASEPRG